jgi:hypothetical protein
MKPLVLEPRVKPLAALTTCALSQPSNQPSIAQMQQLDKRQTLQRVHLPNEFPINAPLVPGSAYQYWSNRNLCPAHNSGKVVGHFAFPSFDGQPCIECEKRFHWIASRSSFCIEPLNYWFSVELAKVTSIVHMAMRL